MTGSSPTASTGSAPRSSSSAPSSRLYRFHARGAGRVYALAARPDFVAALAALLGVLVFDTLPGLFIGIAVSILLLLYRSSRPRVAELGRVPGTEQWSDLGRHPENERVPGIVVLRPESGLFFANADTVRDAIRERSAGASAVVLDAETVPAIDVTAVSMLVALAEDLRRESVELVIARDIGPVRDLLRLEEDERAIKTYPTVRAAVDSLRRGPGDV